jgi:phosphate transport system permease protein
MVQSQGLSTTNTLGPGGPGKSAGRWADDAFRLLTLAAGMLILAILALIAFSTVQNAWPAFRSEGLKYFTGRAWVPSQNKFGIVTYVYGTIVVSAIAVVFAVPVSVGIALFVTEIAPKPVRVAVNSVMDLLAGVPSVVFGLWGILVLAPQMAGFYDRVAGWFGGVPGLRHVFDKTQTGRSFFTAGLILALMITPIITSVTREVFATVPRNDKDGALALGATRWEMIKGVVLPHSIGGMVGATMLGLGRAMGETIAVALTIGSVPRIAANLFGNGYAMPAVIANEFNESSGDYRAALIGLGVSLFVLTIVVNVTARFVVARFNTRMQGAA